MCGCGVWGHRSAVTLAVLGEQLDTMILEVYSNLRYHGWLLTSCINRVTHWISRLEIVVLGYLSLVSVSEVCLGTGYFHFPSKWTSKPLRQQWLQTAWTKWNLILYYVFWKVFMVKFLLNVFQILCYSKHLIIATCFQHKFWLKPVQARW